jgi:hypothetical protein
MSDNTCECCGEKPVWKEARAHGYELCEDCAMTTACSECDSEGDEEHYIWDAGLCERCRRHSESCAWLDNMEARLNAAAEAGGWNIELKSIAQTRTRYYELTRETSDDDTETIIVRIGDHATAHCREDYSIAMRPSGDDHDAQKVLAKISDLGALK